MVFYFYISESILVFSFKFFKMPRAPKGKKEKADAHEDSDVAVKDGENNDETDSNVSETSKKRNSRGRVKTDDKKKAEDDEEIEENGGERKTKRKKENTSYSEESSNEGDDEKNEKEEKNFKKQEKEKKNSAHCTLYEFEMYNSSKRLHSFFVFERVLIHILSASVYTQIYVYL